MHGLVEISLFELSGSLDAIQTSEIREETCHLFPGWTERWRWNPTHQKPKGNRHGQRQNWETFQAQQERYQKIDGKDLSEGRIEHFAATVAGKSDKSQVGKENGRGKLVRSSQNRVQNLRRHPKQSTAKNLREDNRILQYKDRRRVSLHGSDHRNVSGQPWIILKDPKHKTSQKYQRSIKKITLIKKCKRS